MRGLSDPEATIALMIPGGTRKREMRGLEGGEGVRMLRGHDTSTYGHNGEQQHVGIALA